MEHGLFRGSTKVRKGTSEIALNRRQGIHAEEEEEEAVIVDENGWRPHRRFFDAA